MYTLCVYEHWLRNWLHTMLSIAHKTGRARKNKDAWEPKMQSTAQSMQSSIQCSQLYNAAENNRRIVKTVIMTACMPT